MNEDYPRQHEREGCFGIWPMRLMLPKCPTCRIRFMPHKGARPVCPKCNRDIHEPRDQGRP